VSRILGLLLIATLVLTGCDPYPENQTVTDEGERGSWTYLEGPNGEKCLIYWKPYSHGSISGMHCDRVNWEAP
jgi:hypothetical protein